MKNVCNIKTIDDLIKELEEYKKTLGGGAAVVMSQDEEGNAYGDILMLDSDNTKQFLEYCDDYYRGYDKDPAIKPEGRNGNKNILIIFPNL